MSLAHGHRNVWHGFVVHSTQLAAAGRVDILRDASIGELYAPRAVVVIIFDERDALVQVPRHGTVGVEGIFLLHVVVIIVEVERALADKARRTVNDFL